MARFFLTFFAILALAAPASAGKPWRGEWNLFDSDCADTNDTDIHGNGPPAGSVDLTTLANWDTMNEAYDLQLNFRAPAQVSGSADGLCDATPWTIKGAITNSGTTNLYIGPVWLPASGGMSAAEYGTIVTSYQWGMVMQQPWALSTHRILATTGAITTTTSVLRPIGPQGESSGQIATTDQFPILEGARVFLWRQLAGAGAFVLDESIYTWKSESDPDS